MPNLPIGYNEQPSLDDKEIRIIVLEEFIKKARSESELIDMNGSFKVVLPYWFMKDDIL